MISLLFSSDRERENRKMQNIFDCGQIVSWSGESQGSHRFSPLEGLVVSAPGDTPFAWLIIILGG